MLDKWAPSSRISICTESKKINYLSSENSSSSSEKYVGSKNLKTLKIKVLRELVP